MVYDIDNKKVIFTVEDGKDIAAIEKLTREEMIKIIENLIEENGELESQNEDLQMEVEELKDEKEGLEDYCREIRGLA